MQEKRQQEEFEAARLKDEVIEQRRWEEFEAAQRREAREAEDRKALYKLQERQWEWPQSRKMSETEKRNTPAAQITFSATSSKTLCQNCPPM